MDLVSASLVNEFSTERGIAHLSEEKRFEQFCSFVTICQHYADTFDPADTLAGSNFGIDGIAIIVNGELVTDIDDLTEFTNTAELDVTFVFVQADRSASFDTGKMGNIGTAVLDFFKETPALPQTEEVKAAAAIKLELIRHSSKFKRGNPICRLYYATTGTWATDATLELKRKGVVEDLRGTNLFREVTFTPLGASEIQKLYRQSRNAIEREFVFDKQIPIPEIGGVTQSFLGYLPVPEFLKIVSDDNGNMLGGLFYSNPRDWQDYNPVNSEIKGTLQSDSKNRFVLMNNGITIIAREVRITGNKFLITDYSIVNGCQTSHVLFDVADKNDPSVMVPVRLIGTQNEAVINAIIRATNRQTPVPEDQFFALEEFPKQLEEFFKAFPDQQKKLYYERRSRQYENQALEKTRIVTQPNVIRAFAAMFLDEAHRTTKNYAALKAKVGKEIFASGHREHPYYTAAFALYKLEFLFRNGKVGAQYKPARFHILLAARRLAAAEELPRFNSHDMERYCKPIMELLWDSVGGDDLLNKAVEVVNHVAAGNFDRDHIRTESFTQQVIARCSGMTAVKAS